MKEKTHLIKGPIGEELEIPFDFKESEYSDGDLLKFYEDNGYAIRRSLFKKDECEKMLRSFYSEVKPYKGHIYRQASANPERHRLTGSGNMLNSILNIQSLRKKSFYNFVESGTEILTQKGLVKDLEMVFGEKPKLVQSMYFEGNPVTWAHQDTYYLDSEEIGSMCGVWIALEDIHPEAGRFYIYPKSHKIDIQKNGGDFEIAFHHERYKELVKKVIEKEGLECIAPPLKAGDVLFWNSKTIHGSLQTTDSTKTRNSITGHYIPNSQQFLQFQKFEKALSLVELNGIQVNKPKDLNVGFNYLIFCIEITFPKLFQFLKKSVIRYKLKS